MAVKSLIMRKYRFWGGCPGVPPRMARKMLEMIGVVFRNREELASCILLGSPESRIAQDLGPTDFIAQST